MVNRGKYHLPLRDPDGIGYFRIRSVAPNRFYPSISQLTMDQLTFDSITYLVVSAYFLSGALAAIIAHYKGRSFGLWLAIGLTCGIAALLVALVMKREKPL